MPVVFNGTDQWLNMAAPVTGFPFTMGGWAFATADSAAQTPFSMADSGTDTNYWASRRIGAGDYHQGLLNATGGAVSFGGSSFDDWLVNTWHHIVWVETAANDRETFLDGVSTGTDTNSRTPSSVDDFAIGANAKGTTDEFFTGRLFWPFVYSAALSANDILMLAKGASSRTIRRDALVSFPRLLFEEHRDLINHTALTVNGSPTVNNDRPYQTRLISGRGRDRGRTRMSA